MGDIIDFDELTSNGFLSEWYAIPVLVILILIKVFAEKKYQDNIDENSKKKKEDS